MDVWKRHHKNNLKPFLLVCWCRVLSFYCKFQRSYKSKHSQWNWKSPSLRLPFFAISADVVLVVHDEMFQLKPWEDLVLRYSKCFIFQRHGNRLPLDPKRTQWLMLGHQTLPRHPIGIWRSRLFSPTVLHLHPLSFLMNGQYWTFFSR